jgi:hypothetical protein
MSYTINGKVDGSDGLKIKGKMGKIISTETE